MLTLSCSSTNRHVSRYGLLIDNDARCGRSCQQQEKSLCSRVLFSSLQHRDQRSALCCSIACVSVYVPCLLCSLPMPMPCQVHGAAAEATKDTENQERGTAIYHLMIRNRACSTAVVVLLLSFSGCCLHEQKREPFWLMPLKRECEFRKGM